MTESGYHELRQQLQQLKDNQRIYKSKLKEMNQTRGKIADQLDVLQQTYDKKIKHLEQKLASFKGENQALTKQNILFRTEIENFQLRLVEKEKIIALLLQQKRDVQTGSGSDRSKSEKTDSLRANQDERGFRKNGVVDLNTIGKQRESQGQGRVYKGESIDSGERGGEEKRIMVYPPGKNKKMKSQIHNTIETEPFKQQLTVLRQQTVNVAEEVEQQNQPEQIPHPVQVRAPPPPRATKKKAPRGLPPKRVPLQNSFEDIQDPQEPSSQLLMNYFSGASQQDVKQPQEIPVIVKPEQNQIQVCVEDQEVRYEMQEEEVISPVYQDYQSNLYNLNEGVKQDEEIYQEEKRPQRNSNSRQFATATKNQEEPSLLSHFGQEEGQGDSMMEVMTRPKAISKKKKKTPSKPNLQPSFQTQAHFDGEQQSNSTDFFQQLGKQDNEVEPDHGLEMEQSSIDHIERDNSVISNQQPYFALQGVTQQRQVTRPVKMTKKKAKRDKIKVVDPSLFE